MESLILRLCSMPARTIFNQSTLALVTNETIFGTSYQTKLAHEYLVDGTVGILSDNLLTRVLTLNDLSASGQYYIDLQAGIIYSIEVPALNTIIRYVYHANPFVARASPVIISNLQSGPFVSKLFDQLVDDLGDENNGPLSLLGLDIVNELYSVYPWYWGK
jgi:hypothetical protein